MMCSCCFLYTLLFVSSPQPECDIKKSLHRNCQLLHDRQDRLLIAIEFTCVRINPFYVAGLTPSMSQD